jgi:hypothetical protein
MVGYFVSSGDPEVDSMFAPYVWGATGLANLLKPLKLKNYGTELKLLLIEYYVEGKFTEHLFDEIRLRNYSTKSKDISAQVPVRRSDFHDRTDRQRREFLLKTTLEAIELVRGRLEKRKLGVDFDRLRQDVEAVGIDFVAAAREQ